MFCSCLARRFSIPLAGMLTMLALLWGFFPTPAAHAQSAPFLLRDINTTTTDHHGSMPRSVAVIGGTVYYTANDPVFGAELWKSDGTAAGTLMVRDLWPGAGSSNPAQLTAAGNVLFFAANDGVHGQELWRSDGTAAGTWMVKDIFFGQGSSAVRDMVAFKNKLYFLASDGIHGRTLWCSDGTAAGTLMVKDLGPMQCQSPYSLAVVNQTLFFLGYGHDMASGYAIGLFKSDGTAAGTSLVKPGVTQSSLTQLWNANGRVYFDAYDSSYNVQLWSSDGTAAGTASVFRASSPTYVESLAALNGATYFASRDSLTSLTLWKTDGTARGTLKVKTIYAKSDPYSFPPYYRVEFPFIEAGGKLYFCAEGQTDGMELWCSTGSGAGTVRVKDINPGNKGSYPSSLTNVGGRLYFFASDGSHGAELWKSDGTATGTVMIKDVNPGTADLLDGSYTSWWSAESQIVPLAGGANGNALFVANDGAHGSELWKTNGTAAGTFLVRDAAVGSDSFPASMTACGKTLFFTVDDTVHGRELWKSNGTAAGTGLVRDITPGPAGGCDINREPYVTSSSLPYAYPAPVNTTLMASMGGAVYFAASDNVHGLALYRSDGTAAGTYALKDRLPSIVALAAAGRNVFFLSILDEPTSVSQYFKHTFELWRSDGTKLNTNLLKRSQFSDYNIYGSYGDHPMIAVGSKVYFTIPDTMGHTLWKSDGTVGGTVMVIPSYLDPGVMAPDNLTAVGNRVFFTNSQNLWVTDGTFAGTRPVNGTAPNGPPTKSLTALNGKLIYVSYEYLHGEELWISDGTAAGTHLLKDLWPGVEGSRPENLTVVGNKLFFSATDYAHGRELWVTHGTPGGTRMVRDLCSGWAGSHPANLVAMGNILLFSAYDWQHGDELWMSDGTAAGTRMACDMAAGKRGANPQDFAVIGNMLFFTALNGSNPKQGRELWGWKMPMTIR